MTAPALTFVEAVRDFIDLNAESTSAYSDQTIASNIRAASWFLERVTGRIFGDRTQRMVFSTNGAASITIPGLRNPDTVTLSGSALAVDESYWLIPDVQQTGVYTGIQLRGFEDRRDGPSYLHYPDWFDTNKDSRLWWGRGSLANDLVFGSGSTWGYTDANLPEPVRFATKVLAAFFTKYPDAVLVGSTQTAQGSSIDLSGFPLPVQQFITDWSVRQGVAGV